MKFSTVAAVAAAINIISINGVEAAEKYGIAGPEAIFLTQAMNAKRARHNHTLPVSYTSTISDKCESIMKELDCANPNVIAHKAFGSTVSIGFEIEAAIDEWYSEFFHYNYDNPAVTQDNSNFLQMIWKPVTKIGCCKKTCPGTGKVILCQYDQRVNPLSLPSGIGELLLDTVTITETVNGYTTITDATTLTDILTLDTQTITLSDVTSIITTTLTIDEPGEPTTTTETITLDANTETETVTDSVTETETVPGNENIITTFVTDFQTTTETITENAQTSTETETITVNEEPITVTETVTGEAETVTETETLSASAAEDLTETVTLTKTQTDFTTETTTITDTTTLTKTQVKTENFVAKYSASLSLTDFV
ncbi:hypothetical protein, no similarity [Maudiozyma barnettii]|nr:hypothetical protein, no similarity [Kazachstania barnettii]